MSTLLLMCGRTSIFTMVGGGVRGEDAGIARATTTQVGFTLQASHLFTDGYLRVGGVITRIIVGEDTNGVTIESHITSLNGIGAAGKRAGIGKSNRLGVSKV